MATTIVELYENAGMSPQQIAEDQSLEILAVKATLAAHSELFRNAVAEQTSKVISAEMGVEVPEAQAVDLEGAQVVEAGSEKREAEERFTKEEIDDIKRTMFTIMRDGENDSVRLKAAIYLNEESTGRNERRISSAAEAGKLNVLMISDIMRKAKAAVNRVREKRTEKVIELA